jgi:NAD(P)-dependent dehydrogenase (short-subunit alcohol dehydrogenase family)
LLGSFDRFGFRRHARRFAPSDLEVDLRGKRAVVTGASSGIGFAAAECLVAHGATVALVCRDQQRGEEALARLHAAHPGARLELRRLDVATVAEVRRFCDEEPGPIDMLVHNAGVLPPQREVTSDGLELSFATHVAGPHLMTALLADRLRPQARVVFVSSGGMYLTRLSLDDLDWRLRPYDGATAYVQTKRMQIVLAEAWAERLAPISAYAYAMHPGWADTPSVRASLPRFYKMTRPILRTAAEGADTIVWLCARAIPAIPSGALFFDRRAVGTHYLPWTSERPADRAALLALLDHLLDRP